MKEVFSPSERRMEIFYILMNHKLITRRELARMFNVSDDAITRDITALSRFVPIGSKMGRYGGIYIS
ncbi:MAG: HTH domain-containing protein [Oscillospiraceae bacterium]|nr:HTH domain-containing protein [Oscillospiraceae bacterium]